LSPLLAITAIAITALADAKPTIAADGKKVEAKIVRTMKKIHQGTTIRLGSLKEVTEKIELPPGALKSRTEAEGRIARYDIYADEIVTANHLCPVNLGAPLVKAGKFKEAEAFYKKALLGTDWFQNITIILDEYADVLRRTRRTDQAAALVSASKQLRAEKDRDAKFGQIESELRAKKKSDNALAAQLWLYGQKYPADTNQYHQALLTVADSYIATGQFQKALELFDKKLKIDTAAKARPSANLQRPEVFDAKGQLVAANIIKRYTSDTIRLKVDDSDIAYDHFDKGVALAGLKKHDQAIAEFNLAKKTTSPVLAARADARLAQIYATKGDKTKAESLKAESLKTIPACPECKSNLNAVQISYGLRAGRHPRDGRDWTQGGCVIEKEKFFCKTNATNY